jgi:hypothetical protein
MVVFNPSGVRLPEVLVEVVKDQMRVNRHGFSFHAVIGDDDVVLRTLDRGTYLNELKNITEKSPRLLHTHLRLASAGVINGENIHMWRVANRYISHNGSVALFAHYPSEPYLYHLHQTDRPAKSDTLQLIESPEFINALNLLDSKPRELWNVLKKYGFYGVMFMTSKDEVVAVSVNKPLYIYATKHLLVFVNEPIEFVKPVKRFGFKLDLNTVPYTSYRNVIIRYATEKMKPLFFRPKPKPTKPWPKPWHELGYDYLGDWWWSQ